MDLLPAIDLMGGEVVRLRQGKADQKTVYSRNPGNFARKWQDDGGDWLHLVDLDGAFEGGPRNFSAVEEILRNVSIPCELGGGMREVASVQKALNLGISRVILGSRACTDTDFVRECLDCFGPDKIAVGIDAKDGHVALKGWVENSKIPALDLAGRMSGIGVETIIYTDIATDGMLAGPNFEAMRELAENFPGKIIASGGVASNQDILSLSKIPGIIGVIIGKALYEGKVDLKACRSSIN